MYKKSIFLFTRDLRTEDNTSLNQAFVQSKEVIPIFVFNPDQVDKKNNYRSMNAIQFMIESLFELEQKIHKEGGRLHFWYNDPLEIIKKICTKINGIEALFLNKDYTPFAKIREKNLQELCTKITIKYNSYQDYLLTNPDQVIEHKDSFYKLFTPFFNRAKNFPVENPTVSNKTKKAWSKTIFDSSKSLSVIRNMIMNDYDNSNLYSTGGRTHGKKILDTISLLKNYSQTKDYPEQPTSFLGAHLRFGTVSIREAYHTMKDSLGNGHPLIRQLYWREFFTHTAFFHPKIFGHPMKKQYETIIWNTNQHDFQRWCNGTTGFPIVDAGMRQLNTTGWMHNRVRMIVASFLIKDLHIDWKWGEQYFATQLVDYDPAVNNGNWQWAASTGFDSQPYFRIFNPWEQSKKFDPDCSYIKTWIPELKKIDSKIIQHWNIKHISKIYHKPLIDHQEESLKSKTIFKAQNNHFTIKN